MNKGKAIAKSQVAIGRGLREFAAGAGCSQLHEGVSPQDGAGGRTSRLSEIIKPKVVKLNEGGVPLLVQSVVEDAKLAAFIDDAIAYTITEMGQLQGSVGKREIDALRNIRGKVFVQGMSADVLQFVADAYRCLKY